MKKLNIISVNILFFIILIFLAEIYVFYSETKKLDILDRIYRPNFLYGYTISPINTFINVFNDVNITDNKYLFRHPNIVESDKRPIVLFGCSYAYGSGLSPNKTFSYKLSQLSHKSVYNYGVPRFGTQHMLYFLKTNFINKDINNPEYFIYIFIGGHIQRLYIQNEYFNRILLFYKETKNNNNDLALKNDFDIFWWHSYSLRKLKEFLYFKNEEKNKEKDSKFLLKHLIQINNEIKNKFPNAKFVILSYNGDEYLKYIENELNDNNIETIYLQELAETNINIKPYVLEDYHPSEAAWDLITPLIIKKLSL